MTNHALYYGTTLIAPNGTHTLGAVADAFTTHLLDFDWGEAPKDIREDERPNADGMLRRGAAYGGRDFYHAIGIRVDVTKFASAAIEDARDDAVEAVINLLGDDTLVAVKQNRKNSAGTAVSRVLYAEPTPIRAPKWSKTDWAEGLVGGYDMPDAVVAVHWHAPFPWFVDAAETATAALTMDGTERSQTIVNASPRRVPLGFRILGTGSGITAVVYNDTSGHDDAIVGAGVTLTDLTLSATDATVYDQYVTDPQVFEVYKATTDLMAKVAAKPRVWLEPGNNTIKRQVTVGSATGGTIVFFHRGWHKVP